MKCNFARLVILFLSIAMLAQQKAFAQNGLFKKLSKIELYAGAGPSWLQINTVARTSTYNNHRPFYGYALGLTIRRKVIAQKIEFVLRLEFDRKGGSFFSQSDTLYNSSGGVIGSIAPHSETYKLNYLSMPFVFQYSIGKSNAFSFGMGGYVSKLLKSKFETHYSNSTYTTTVSGLEGLDFGATFLAKATGTSKILSDKLGALIMFNYGLYNICQSSLTSIKSRSLVLAITYKLK